jgi:hypothetical protein
MCATRCRITAISLPFPRLLIWNLPKHVLMIFKSRCLPENGNASGPVLQVSPETVAAQTAILAHRGRAASRSFSQIISDARDDYLLRQAGYFPTTTRKDPVGFRVDSGEPGPAPSRPSAFCVRAADAAMGVKSPANDREISQPQPTGATATF